MCNAFKRHLLLLILVLSNKCRDADDMLHRRNNAAISIFSSALWTGLLFLSFKNSFLLFCPFQIQEKHLGNEVVFDVKKKLHYKQIHPEIILENTYVPDKFSRLE